MTRQKNAMLTTEDRRWLTGEKTYDGQHAKQQRYQRRNDIRERVYNSILDFTILFESLEEDERAEIFGEVTEDGRQWVDTDEEFREGVRDALAFLLRGVGVRTRMRDSAGSGSPHVVDRLLELALIRAGQKEGYLVEDARLDVEAANMTVPDLLAALETDAGISPAGVYFLLESGALDTERVHECLRDHVLHEDGGGE